MSKYISTIGIDYGVKPTKIKGRDVRVNFWDMSGSEAFFEVRNEFYKDASGALLVYDVSNKKSFEVRIDRRALRKESAGTTLRAKQ